MTLNIGILEGGAVAEEYWPHLRTFTDSFRQFLALDDRASHLHPYLCYEGEFPESVNAHDGWLITGSAASVYDGDPWIADLEAFVRTAAEVRPVVGICFGHQLVAQAFGGTVAKAPGWGVGVHKHDVRVQADWMRPTLSDISLLASHQDQVQVPPPGAKVLGGSEFCPNGLMTIGDNVMTIQNHPELTKEFAEDLYQRRRGPLGSATTDAALNSLELATDEAAVASWILNFLSQ